MNVRFLEPARDEFQSAVEFYDQQADGLGRELADEVESLLEKLRESPRLGAPHVEGSRRVPLRRFPFNLVYSVEPDAVLVVALAHQRRAPGYWTHRE